MRLSKILLVLLVCILPVFAQTSTVLRPTNSIIVPVPAIGTGSMTLEFQWHGMTIPAAQWQQKFADHGDWNPRIWATPSGGGTLYVLWSADQSRECFVPIAGHDNLLVRLVRDAATSQHRCEAWDADGTWYFNTTTAVTTFGNMTATSMGVGGGTNSDGGLSFLRMAPVATPLGSKPPTIGDSYHAASYYSVWLPFENSPNDISGNDRNATVSGTGACGQPFCYTATPDLLPVVVVKSPWHKSWMDVYTTGSIRAGYPAVMNGDDSFVMSPLGQKTCFWQIVERPAGAPQPRLSDHDSCVTTVTETVFGQYMFRLTVTDETGAVTVKDQPVGAVATDDNGVVVTNNERADEIFGPMIAWVRNPWMYADERAYEGYRQQTARWDASGGAYWMRTGQGTVSYTEGGDTNSSTTFTGACSDTATSCAVADAGELPSLSTLPTWVTAFNGTTREIMRVCSTTATDGPATLTFCFGGRAIPRQLQSYVGAAAGDFSDVPLNLIAGNSVSDYQVTGTGTLFISDPVTPICPAGAPGPSGAVTHSTGTVTLTAGSTSIPGTGTNWTTSTGGTVQLNNMIRVEATHSGGTPYIYWARITAIDTGTQTLTVNRPVPVGTDAGPFPHKVTGPRVVSLHFQSVDNRDAMAINNVHGCESETQLHVRKYVDLPGVNNTVQTNQKYGYVGGVGIQGEYGWGFYNPVMSNYALHYRSGLAGPKLKGAEIAETFVRNPETCSGYCGGQTFYRGGGIVDAFVHLALGNNTDLQWGDVRQFVRGSQNIGSSPCYEADGRTVAYNGSRVVMGALYDPDDTLRATWQTVLQSLNTRDNNCKGSFNALETNMWPSGAYFGPASPRMVLTSGQTLVTPYTAGSFTSTIAKVTADGTATATVGSPTITAVTGTFVTGSAITVVGTKAGATYQQRHTFTQAGGTSATFTTPATWQGDSGTVSWVVESTSFPTAIGTGGADAQNLRVGYALKYVSANELRLNKPFQGPSGDAYYAYTGNVAGWGVQPFMAGMDATRMRWGSKLDATLSTNFGANALARAQWYKDYGYDPVTKGSYYARGPGACEPPINPVPECAYGVGSSKAARVLSAESVGSMGYLYINTPTVEVKDWVDIAYGAIWGKPEWTEAGYYSDSYWVSDEFSNGSYRNYSKYQGMAFGMGLTHQWPAIRVGGVAPETLQARSIGYKLSSVPNAASARVTLKYPSGYSPTPTACSATLCTFNVDTRQGSALVTLEYLNAGGFVISSSSTPVSVK